MGLGTRYCWGGTCRAAQESAVWAAFSDWRISRHGEVRRGNGERASDVEVEWLLMVVKESLFSLLRL